MSPLINDDTSSLRLLGNGSLPKESTEPGVRLLEAFPNKFPGNYYIISLTFPEFTSLCPVTGQPDFGTVCLEYIPHALCVESKSFKLYMFAWRNHPSFMETIVNNMLEDFTSLLAPYWCRVKGLFAPRGGTRIHVFAERFKDTDDVTGKYVHQAVTNWRMEARVETPR